MVFRLCRLGKLPEPRYLNDPVANNFMSFHSNCLLYLLLAINGATAMEIAYISEKFYVHLKMEITVPMS
jgi:hypothetical protein